MVPRARSLNPTDRELTVEERTNNRSGYSVVEVVNMTEFTIGSKVTKEELDEEINRGTRVIIR